MLKLYTFIFIIFFQTIILAQAPANDNCFSAITLTISQTCNPVISSIANANQSYPPNFCGSGASSTALDVWFKFVATATSLTIVVTPTNVVLNDFNIVTELYATCATNTVVPTAITCANVGGFDQSETINATSLTIGQAYYVRVYQYKNSTTSPAPANPAFSICVVDPSITTSINQPNTTLSLTVFPNPVTNGEFIIKNVTTTSNIRLYNALGQAISFIKSINNNEPNQLNIKYDPQLHKGLVLVEITNETNQAKIYKLINN